MAPNRAVAVINSYPCDQHELDLALRFAADNEGPIELVHQLIRVAVSLQGKGFDNSVDDLVRYFGSRECQADDLDLLKILLEAGAVVDELPPHLRANWSHPNNFFHATDYLLLSGSYSMHNRGLWSLVSWYSDRQQTTVTVPGIFEAAQLGLEQLNSYLEARAEPSSDDDRMETLELALSEASERGYANVLQNWVQFGVDPNVRMLSKNELYRDTWHPVIRATNAGQMDTLRVLVNISGLDIAFLNTEMCRLKQLDLCALRNMESSQLHQILRLLSAWDLTPDTRTCISLNALEDHGCDSCPHELL